MVKKESPFFVKAIHESSATPETKTHGLFSAYRFDVLNEDNQKKVIEEDCKVRTTCTLFRPLSSRICC
jgi:hypothetical protein